MTPPAAAPSPAAPPAAAPHAGPYVAAPSPAAPRGLVSGALARRYLMSGVAAALGLLAVAWPLAWAPGWAYAVALAGAVAALAAAFAGWQRGAVIAVAAAIASCAFSRAGIGVLTAEGLFILGYLIAAHAPAGLSQPGRWLRHQVRLCAAGVIAGGAVLAVFALHPADSAWLTVAGLAAAVAAYLIALPSLRDRRGSRRAESGQPPVQPPEKPGP